MGDHLNRENAADLSDSRLLGKYSRLCSDIPNFKSAFELFLGTFDQAAVGIVHMLKDGRISLHNQCARRILGYPFEAFSEENFHDLLHKDERASLIEQQRHLSERHINRYSLECRIKHAAGHFVWTHVTVAPQQNVEGCPEHFIVTLQDVSERKLAEEKYQKAKQDLQINLAQLEALIAHLPQGILIFSARGELHRANPAAIRMRAQEMLLPPRNPSEAQLRLFSSEGEEVAPGGWPLELALQGSTVQDLICEVSDRLNSNTSSWQCFNAVPIYRKCGELLLVIVSVHDISVQKRVELALRESELGYKQLADSMPHIVWVCDSEGRLTFFNQRWYEFTGLSKVDECDESLWKHLLHPDEVQLIYDAFGNCLKTGKPLEVEIRLKSRLTATYEWYLVKSAPAKNAEGKITRWYGTSTNIHHQKMVEEKLRRADKAKDEFFAVLSHELRSPLNVILGYTDLLKGRDRSAINLNEALEAIERNAKAQAQLVGDLLEVSKIISGHLPIERQRFDPRILMQDAIESVRFAASAKNVQLSVHVDSTIDQLEGDPHRIRQVLWNLLSNAIKFTPEKGVVTLEVAVVGDFYEMRIRDTGIGLTADALAHVFDRFWQEDSTGTCKQFGLGLGLSIVKHLVEIHEGKVWAESEGRNRGAAFIVRLPLGQSSLPPKRFPPKARNLEPQRQELQQGRELEGRMILVVDDQEDATRLVQRILENVGAEVYCAHSGEEALRTLKEQRFNLIISDISMPEMDGLDLLRELRLWETEDKQDPTPAIALATYTGEFSDEQLAEVGYQRYLLKPISYRVLVNEVLTVLVQTSGQSHPTTLAAVDRLF